jgi:hypothetical protein
MNLLKSHDFRCISTLLARFVVLRLPLSPYIARLVFSTYMDYAPLLVQPFPMYAVARVADEEKNH